MRWTTLSLMVFAISMMPTRSLALRVNEYIQKLDQSSTKDKFDHAFGAMITEFKSGKLSFTDKEVMDIVNISRKKPFAELLLPAVYGWAATMFGDGRMDEALKYFMASAQLYEKQNKRFAQALSYFEMALIQHKAENYEEAETYYNKTLSLAGDSLNHRTKINCYNGLALIQRTYKNYYNAMHDFRMANNVAAVNRDTVWMGILAGNIGSIHLATGNCDSSLFYYFKNLRFIRNTPEFENEIEAYSHLANVYLIKGNLTNAGIYLDSAVRIITTRKIKFNDFFNPMDYIHQTYASLYASTGDFKKAFEHYTQYHQIAAHKQQTINGQSLKHLQSTYAFEQKQNELDLLQKINGANVLVIQQQRFIGIASGFIILLVSALAYVAFRTGSQRKNLNKKLYDSNTELERLNTVKDKLFSVLSHDLRAPIGSLRSILDLLNNAYLSPKESTRLLAKLNQQLEISGNVLETLLQWAKAELSETKADTQKVILADVVNNVALQLKELMEEKNIRFCNDINFHLIALADKTQVEIILRNLIGNAIKFTPAGGIINIAGKIGDDTIEINVEDNGMGMQEDEVENLFQPGKHFSKEGTNQEKGTGLGLLITKEMIAKNGGSIRVNSSKQNGTVFTFTLPIAS